MGHYQGKPEDRPLTGKQTAFVDEYLINGFNATQAAMTVNYCLTAKDRQLACKSQGSRTLSNANVKQALIKRRAETAVETGITTESVVKDLDRLAKHCLGETHLIAGKDPVIDAAGAKGALELLGRHTGAFERDNAQRGDKTVIIISQE